MNRFNKRGRPRKDGQGSKGKERSYWLGELFVDYGGCAWATELVEVAPIDGRRRWEALPIYLGREADTVLILQDEKPIPEGMHPRLRAVLVRIVGDVDKENIRSDKHDDRTQRFSFRKRTRRGFRGNYRYGL